MLDGSFGTPPETEPAEEVSMEDLVTVYREGFHAGPASIDICIAKGIRAILARVKPQVKVTG